jgi:hypothetical protein
MNINIYIFSVMKKIYRVVKHTHYEKGEINKEHYTIQRQTKFLWWKLWGDITDIQCYDGDCQTYPIMFDTENKAITMINNLQNGYKLKGWDKEVTKVLEFPID